MRFLVTGAGRGLGLELVREGVIRGIHIVAAYRGMNAGLAEICEKYPGYVSLIYMDVSSSESVKDASSKIAQRFSMLNGFINNAGILFERNDDHDPVIDVDIEKAEMTFNVNVMGPIRVMKYFSPLVYAARGQERCIVTISSAAAILTNTNPLYGVYAASKSAINNYTQRARNYFASKPDKQDIRVYMIHPGTMNTKMSPYGDMRNHIEPSESASGIWDIITRKKDISSTIPFYDYKGILMPR